MKITFLILLIVTGFCQLSKAQTKAGNDEEHILEITYYNTGSERGGRLDLILSKDSIKCHYWGIWAPEHRTPAYGYKKKIKQRDWKILINSFSLSDFDDIPQSEATSPLDGVDQILIVKTSKREHRLIVTHDMAVYNGVKYNAIRQVKEILMADLKNYK